MNREILKTPEADQQRKEREKEAARESPADRWREHPQREIEDPFEAVRRQRAVWEGM